MYRHTLVFWLKAGVAPHKIEYPRLAIQTILLGDAEHGWVCHFGLKCSSWTTINVGTSGRSPCTPLGNLLYVSVQQGNTMASRNFGLLKVFGNIFNFHIVWTCLSNLYYIVRGMKATKAFPCLGTCSFPSSKGNPADDVGGLPQRNLSDRATCQ